VPEDIRTSVKITTFTLRKDHELEKKSHLLKNSMTRISAIYVYISFPPPLNFFYYCVCGVGGGGKKTMNDVEKGGRGKWNPLNLKPRFAAD